MHYINQKSWEEISQKNFEKVFMLLNAAEEKITKDSQSMRKFLDFSSKNPNFSMRNTALLFEQYPSGFFFMESGEFENAGYSVKEKEAGNKILLSFAEDGKMVYRIGTVFDISQTDVPEADYRDFLNQEKRYAPEIVVNGLSELASVLAIPLPVDFSGDEHSVDFHQGKVIESKTLDPTNRASEMARAFARALLSMDNARSEIAEEYEFQADTLSTLIGSAFGLDMPDEAYTRMYQHWQVASEKTGLKYFELSVPAFLSFRSHQNEMENYIDQAKEINFVHDNPRTRESAAQKNYILDQQQQMHEGPEVGSKKKGRIIEHDMER